MKPISSSSSFSRFFFSSFSSSSSSSFTNRARAWKHEQQNHGWLDFFTYGQQKWKMNSNNKITETHPKNPKTHNKTTQFKPNPKQKTIKPNPNPKQTNSIQTQKKKKNKKQFQTKPKPKTIQNKTKKKTTKTNWNQPLKKKQNQYQTKTQNQAKQQDNIIHDKENIRQRPKTGRWWQKRRRVRTQLLK
jgi:outer membrane biosynthesis protein TonB